MNSPGHVRPPAVACTSLVSQTSPIIRAADPGATILMGGMAGLGYDFMDECLDAGIADYVDALAYHPYAETLGPPEGYAPKESLCRYLVAMVRYLISRHTSKPLEIWLTELSWTTIPEVPPGVDEYTQACYLLRTFINYADTEVKRVIWFSIYDELPLYNVFSEATGPPSLPMVTTTCSRTSSVPRPRPSRAQRAIPAPTRLLSRRTRSTSPPAQWLWPFGSLTTRQTRLP